MKITDLNIDCLEAILYRLEFQDFLNAADSNKCINHAAKFVFIRKYNKKRLTLRIETPLGRQYIQNYCSFDFSSYKSMDIFDLEVALPLLRCFGCVINKIELRFNGTVHDNYITSYLNQFCTDYLKRICILHIPSDGFDYFKKPFTKLENCTLILNENLDRFVGNNLLNRLFPKMKKLKLDYTCSPFFKNGNTVYHFPCLERLHFNHVNYNFPRACVCKKNIIATIKLNPQLKKLDIYCEMNMFDAQLFQSVEESLQNLETLHLNHFSVPDTFLNNFKLKTIYLKNLKYLLYSYNRSIISPIDLAFTCERLETFNFPARLFNFFYKFIEKHQTISTLSLHFAFSSEIQCCKRLAEICPSLTMVNCIIQFRITIDIICDLMAMFNSLKKVNFELRRSRPGDLLLQLIKDRLNTDWLISITEIVNDYVNFCHVELKQRKKTSTKN